MAHSDIFIFLNIITWLFFCFNLVYIFFICLFLPIYFKQICIRKYILIFFKINLYYCVIANINKSNVLYNFENFFFENFFLKIFKFYFNIKIKFKYKIIFNNFFFFFNKKINNFNQLNNDLKFSIKYIYI